MSSEMMITLVWLVAFAMVVLTVYFIMKFKSQIQPREMDASIRQKREPADWQKPGIVVLGIGIGVFIVGLLNDYRFDLHFTKFKGRLFRTWTINICDFNCTFCR